jgi:hypothetical protein
VGSTGEHRRRRTRTSHRQAQSWAAYLPQPREPWGPRWLRRALDWLYRPVGKPLDPDTLVELTRVPNRMDAETLVRELRLHDVPAELFGADAEGAAPHYGLVQGHRVMVRAGDVGRATDALSGR